MEKKFTVSRREEQTEKLERLRGMLNSAEAVLIGAGAGLSTSAGFTYSGELPASTLMRRSFRSNLPRDRSALRRISEKSFRWSERTEESAAVRRSAR